MVSTQTPRTPPRSSDPSFSLFTPPTPRFAPIDEPDEFYRRRKLQLKDDHYRTDRNQESTAQPTFTTPHIKRTQKLNPTIIPLTPLETPVHRKRNQDLIDALIRTPNSSTSRILFPSNSPVIGSGRVHRGGHSRGHSRDLARVRNKTTVAQPVTNPSHIPVTPQSMKPKRIITVHPPANSAVMPPLIKPDIFKQPSKPFHVFNDHEAFKNEADNEMGVESGTQPTTKLHIPTNSHPHRSLPPDVPGLWYIFRGKKVFRPFPKGDSELSDIKPRKLFSDIELTNAKNTGSGPRSVFSRNKKSQTSIASDSISRIPPFKSSFKEQADPFNSEEEDTDVDDEYGGNRSSSSELLEAPSGQESTSEHYCST